MMKKIICLVLALVTCLSLLTLAVSAADNTFSTFDNKDSFMDGAFADVWVAAYSLESVDSTYKSYNVTHTLVKCECPTTVTVLSLDTESKLPVAVYAMNFEGADECTDEQNIDRINDLLDGGFNVAVVDFSAWSGYTQAELDWVLQYIRVKESGYLGKVSYDSSDITVVAEGYAVARNIVYFNYNDNAPEGILDSITKIYNKDTGFRTDHTIPEGYETATDAYHCVRKDTSPIDFNLYVNIIYPVYRRGADVVMVASSSESNMEVVQKDARPMDVSALTRGYAVAVYDHPYVPMARSDHYGHFGSYSHMGNTGNKSHAAAVRCVRYYADLFGYGKENYASMGISKMAQNGVLTAPEPEAIPEWNSYSDYKDVNGNAFTREDMYGDQPFLAYEDGTPIDSSVSVAYHAMGDGSKYYYNWVSEGVAPTILGCGLFDEYNAWGYWEELQRVYEELGVEYYAYSMYNLGHDFPYGICDFYGYDRWSVFYDIISYYLEGDREARIAYASVYNGKVVGDVTVSDRELKDGRYYVSSTQTPGDELFVQFIAPVTEESLERAVKLFDSEGKEVKGSLRGTSGGSKWYFEPESKLSAGSYTLAVEANTVKSVKSGKTVSDGGEWSFTVE